MRLICVNKDVRHKAGNTDVAASCRVVTVTELDGKDSRSSLFKAMFLPYRAGGANNLPTCQNHHTVGIDHRAVFDRCGFALS